MEKFSVKEFVPKLGVKETSMLLHLLFLFFSYENDALALPIQNDQNIPPDLMVEFRKPPELYSLSEKLRYEILNMLDPKRDVFKESEKELILPTENDYENWEKSDLFQEIEKFVPEIDRKMSQKDVTLKLHEVLDREVRFFLENLHTTFRYREYFSLTYGEAMDVAKALVKGEANEFVDDLFANYIQTVLYISCEEEGNLEEYNKCCQEYYAYYSSDLTELRGYALLFLKKYYLIDAFLRFD